jgi:hypothetical protein
MKRSTLTFILVLAISAMVYPAASASGLCANKNAYLQLLVSKGKIAALPDPIMHSNSCGAEWSKYGTCCDVNSAKSLVEKQNTALATEFKLIESEIISLSKKFNKLVDDSQNTKKLELKLRLRLEKKKVRSYYRSASTLDQIAKNFDSHHKTCQQRISAIRSNSICPICSGRSQVFFEGKNIRISENQCRSILADCEPFWMDIIKTIDLGDQYEDFYDFMNWRFGDIITKIIRRFLEKKLKAFALKAIPKMLLLETESYIDENHLIENLKKCKTGGIDFKSCPFDIAKSLCQQLVEIIPSSYLTSSPYKMSRSQTSRSLKNIHHDNSCESRSDFGGSSKSADKDHFKNKRSHDLESYLGNPFAVQTMTDATCNTYATNVDEDRKCAPMSIVFP